MRRCEAGDLPGLVEFYKLVIRETEGIAERARWEFGKHPTEEAIAAYIAEGAMYAIEREGTIAAAASVTPYQTEEFHGIDWRVDAKDDEVAVVHLLAVNPRFQRRGYARTLMKDVIARAEREGCKAVRLDAIASNGPALKLYESLRFERRGMCRWYEEDIGWFDFYLYEYVGYGALS